MLSIHLEKMNFFAYHGWYPEEKEHGNQFEVSIDIIAKIPDRVEVLADTIDYVKVYAIVAEKMEIATPLLETLAGQMAEAIYQLDNRIQAVSINIKKLTAPIKNFNGIVGITFRKDFNQ